MFKILHNAISFIGLDEMETIIYKSNYSDILSYLKNGVTNKYINYLEDMGVKNELFKDINKLLVAIKKSMKTIEYALPIPVSFNIELTNKCPFRCPQCYCSLNNGKDIDINLALKFIEEAGYMGISFVNLSGGETLVYPHLIELLQGCKNNGIKSAIAISGWNFDADVLNNLLNAGVEKIFVSLNGSCELINSKTRDGFELAINALRILKKSTFTNYYINWVAHDNNIDDFPNLIKLAEKNLVRAVHVLAAKPNIGYEMDSVPSIENFIKLGTFIKSYSNTKLSIVIETCYSPLIFYVYGDMIGKIYCQAGRTNFSLSVDGKMTPCRHIDIEEDYDSIESYWEKSDYLINLRKSFLDVRKPCLGCIYTNACTPCLAVNHKIYKELFKGNEYCPITTITDTAMEI